MKNEKNIVDKIGKWGIVGFILSLPVLIWRSSRIGKIIFIFLILGVGIGAVSKLSDVYFKKIQYRITVGAELAPIKKEISNMGERAKELSFEIKNIENTMKDKKQDALKDIKDKAESEISNKKYEVLSMLVKLEDSIEEAQLAINMIRETERQAVKEKIILIKEKVKIHKKSIDSAEIRLELETIADKLFILTEEERDRFYSDLKEIGFKIEKEKENVAKIYSNTYACSSSSFSYDTR